MVVPAVQQKSSFNQGFPASIGQVLSFPSKQFPRPSTEADSKHSQKAVLNVGRKLSKRQLKKAMLANNNAKGAVAPKVTVSNKKKQKKNKQQEVKAKVNPIPQQPVATTTATLEPTVTRKFDRAAYEVKLAAAKARLASTKAMRGKVTRVISNQGPSTSQDLVTVQLKDMRVKSPTYKQMVDVVFNEAYQEEVFLERKIYPSTNIASGSGKFGWMVESNGFGGKKESYVEVATIESIQAAKVKCNVTRNTSALVRSIGNVDYSLASRMESREIEQLETFDDVPWANPTLVDQGQVDDIVVTVPTVSAEDAAKLDADKTLAALNSMEIKNLERLSNEVEVDPADLTVVAKLTGKLSDEELAGIYTCTLIEARELTDEQLDIMLQEGSDDSAYACLAELNRREDDRLELSKTLAAKAADLVEKNAAIKKASSEAALKVSNIISNRKPYPAMRTTNSERLLSIHHDNGSHKDKRTALAYIKQELADEVITTTTEEVKSVATVPDVKASPVKKKTATVASPLSHKFGGHETKRLMSVTELVDKSLEALWSQELVESAWRVTADHSEALTMFRNVPPKAMDKFKAFVGKLNPFTSSNVSFDTEESLEKTLGSMEVFHPSTDGSASEEQLGLERWLSLRANEVGASPLSPIESVHQVAIVSRINKALNNNRRRELLLTHELCGVDIEAAPKVNTEVYAVGTVLQERLTKPVKRPPVSLEKVKPAAPIAVEPLANSSLSYTKVADMLDLRGERAAQEQVVWRQKLGNAFKSKSLDKVSELFKEHKLSASGILVPAFC